MVEAIAQPQILPTKLHTHSSAVGLKMYCICTKYMQPEHLAQGQIEMVNDGIKKIWVHIYLGYKANMCQNKNFERQVFISIKDVIKAKLE